MAFGSYQSPWMDEDLALFRQAVREFIEDRFVPRVAQWRAQHRPDAEAWIEAGQLGMLLPDVPEEYGGGGGTYAHEAIVTEELALAGVHFGQSIQSLVGQYLLSYGSEAQKRRWLPRLDRGELVAAIAMTEPGAGSDLQAITTTARRDGDHYVVNGSKTFVTNGWHAGLVCLAVKTDPTIAGPKSMSLLLVETAGLAGYHVGRSLEKVGIHEQDTCELFFDDVRVPAGNLLGEVEGKGFQQMMQQLPYERLTVAIGALATAERAVDVTTTYVKERTAFGNPLIELQNTRFVLAECRTRVHVGRIFVDNCISRFIEGRLDPTEAAMAKYWLTELQSRVVDECVQLHGGYGCMLEYPIARMWINSRAQRIYAGANEVMKELIGWSL